MSDLDPVLGKMIFQRVLRWTPVLIGLTLILVAIGLVQTRQLIAGGFLALVGLGLLVLPFTGVFKEAIELD